MREWTIKMREWTINFSNGREPLVVKGETLGKAIEAYLVNNKDLSYAFLSYEDLRYTNLSGANLMGADLSHTDLNYTNLNGANLKCADLKCADLKCANLNCTNLKGVNLDYSCFPLGCGSLDIKIDKRIACQMLYHTLRAMQSVDDKEIKELLNDDKVLALANKFHRVEECGKLQKGEIKNARWKPSKSEHYYFIDQCWKIKATIWEDNDFGNQQYELGNVFKTYEEAKQELEKFKEHFL